MVQLGLKPHPDPKWNETFFPLKSQRVEWLILRYSNGWGVDSLLKTKEFPSFYCNSVWLMKLKEISLGLPDFACFKTLPRQKASCLQFLLPRSLKPCSDEIISGTNSSGFQAVNGAAWGRIFSKQDCNRAGSLPRAVLTHARQNSYFPNNSAWANRNQLQPRRGAPLILLNRMLITGDR